MNAVCAARLHDSRWAYGLGCRCPGALAAERIHRRARRARRAAEREQRFDIAPILAAIEARGILENKHAGIWRLLHRAKVRGYCGALTADRLSIVILGLHPALVWGDAWWLEDVAA